MRNLDLVIWEITDRCNLSCKHCYKNYIVNSENEFATNESIVSVCNELISLKVKTLVISGGEPTLRPDIVLSILRMVSSRISTIMTTNGRKVSKNYISALKQNGLSGIQISIDGINAKIHDSIRGTGSFCAAVNAIEYCVQEHMPVTVMTVPRRDSIDALPEMARWAASLRVSRLGVERPFPCQKGYSSDYYFSSEDLSHLHSVLIEIEKSNIISVHCNDPIFNIRKLVDKCINADIVLSVPEFRPIGCSAARSSIVISANGTIRPCTFINRVIGSLAEKNLNAIWNELAQSSLMRDSAPVDGKCSKCSYYTLCRGCVAQVIALGGAEEGSDTSCYIQTTNCSR